MYNTPNQEELDKAHLDYLENYFSKIHPRARYYLSYAQYVFGFDKKLDEKNIPPIVYFSCYSDNVEILKDRIGKVDNFATVDSYLYDTVDKKIIWGHYCA